MSTEDNNENESKPISRGMLIGQFSKTTRDRLEWALGDASLGMGGSPPTMLGIELARKAAIEHETNVTYKDRGGNTYVFGPQGTVVAGLVWNLEEVFPSNHFQELLEKSLGRDSAEEPTHDQPD